MLVAVYDICADVDFPQLHRCRHRLQLCRCRLAAVVQIKDNRHLCRFQILEIRGPFASQRMHGVTLLDPINFFDMGEHAQPVPPFDSLSEQQQADPAPTVSRLAGASIGAAIRELNAFENAEWNAAMKRRAQSMLQSSVYLRKQCYLLFAVDSLDTSVPCWTSLDIARHIRTSQPKFDTQPKTGGLEALRQLRLHAA
ncbi:hypothetical protein QJQ45_006503 [Haematococcus lacustris]|nr:hypothetical protein QJQ45_006503 [Haematococcus lacustris]